MRMTKLVLATLLVMSASGCGKSAATQVSTHALAATPSTAVGAMSVPAADPTGIAPSAVLPLAAATAPAPAAAPAPTLENITATLGTKKNGVLFGMGKFKCTVDVSNPSSVGRSGTLTVTFLNNGKPSKTAPEVRPLALQPNETRHYEFEDKRWSTDNVQIDVVTKAVAGSTPAAATAPAPIK